jgi:hypothetical protein
MANGSASTGVAELDHALDGLYWGDNVVWVWEVGQIAFQGFFYDAIARLPDRQAAQSQRRAHGLGPPAARRRRGGDAGLPRLIAAISGDRASVHPQGHRARRGGQRAGPVIIGPGRPVLRRGETLLATRRGIDGWRNAGDSDAQCLWVLRD